MSEDDNSGKRGLAPRTAKTAPRKGSSWFFGIGINRYKYFPELNNAVKDVKDFIILMAEQYDLEMDNLITLFDEEATRENIISRLDEFVNLVGPEDKVLIYYSGHGHLNRKTQKGYWIPYDAEVDHTAQYIRNSTIRGYFEDINSLHTLLISDSCFSGTLFLRGANRSASAMEEIERLRSRWALCSGRHDEEVYDGEPGKNSPFAKSIIEVLRDNTSPAVNISKLADRVVELTRANYEQLPEGNPIYGVGHKGGQYVFRLKANEEHIWKQCREADTISAYNDYLDQFPAGQFVPLALACIKEIEDDRSWEDARLRGRLYDIRTYLHRFPEGRHQEEARRQIKLMERDSFPKQVADPFMPDMPERAKVPENSGTKSQPKIIFRIAIILAVTLIGVLATWWLIPKKAPLLATNIRLAAKDSQSGLYGYQDSNGDWVIAPRFEEARAFQDSIASVKKNGLWGFIDRNGNTAIPFAYDSIGHFNTEGKALAYRGDSSFHINHKGERVSGELHEKTEKPSPPVEEKPKQKKAGKQTSSGNSSFSSSQNKTDIRAISMNGKTWMANNLDYDIPSESWCYDGQALNCENHGRLYTWEGARKACESLGQGWRLPNDEDWKALAKAYGGFFDRQSREDIDDPQRSFETLTQQGGSNFNGTLGGFRNPGGNYIGLNDSGHYWTRSASGAESAWSYRFDSNSGKVVRDLNPKSYGLSCRCVKD